MIIKLLSHKVISFQKEEKKRVKYEKTKNSTAPKIKYSHAF